MRTTVLLCGTIGIIASLLHHSCFAQGKLKFGTEWPALKECLELSDETGVWLSKHGDGTSFAWSFYKNGGLEVAWKEDERIYSTNRFGRLRESGAINLYVRKGRWSLERRTLTVNEKTLLQLPARFADQLYLLDIKLEGNSNLTAEERKKGMSANGKILLALAEDPELTSLTRLNFVYAGAELKNSVSNVDVPADNGRLTDFKLVVPEQ